jgi:hypothetical protein
MGYSVKRFAWFMGFVLLTTIVAVPMILLRKKGLSQRELDDNMRYDIDDYMTAEGL